MMLEEGKKAPAFSLPANTGKKVRLADFLGKKVILYFYPKDMTPGCTTQACDFRDHAALLKGKGYVVIGVSKDSVERHETFRDKYELNFPLLSDEEGKVCEKYGVWREKTIYGKKSMGLVRTTFIINQGGKIEKIYNNVRAKEHVERLLRDLD